MRFRLRYLHHDLELGEGQFAVGRSAGCQLSLDDPLVSRRHALLTVTDEGVTVEDLGSRNGVVVNGARIAAATRVHLDPGDRITIGSQELTLLLARDLSRGEARDTGAHGAVGKQTVPRVSAAPPSDRPAPGEASYRDAEPSMVRRAEAFNLLGSIAEKALATGRADEAERLLASALSDVVQASREGKRLSPSLVDMAARFAAKLATATAKGAWADFVIELYQAQGRPCPAPVVDELYGAFRKVNAVDLERLREYLGQLREKANLLGPADKFLLQRIEGLERLAALR